MNTILSQPYHRVSTDRLNREGSQLAASLEGESGPTPAGKTLPHSYPEEASFRWEKVSIIVLLVVLLSKTACELMPSNLPCLIELIDWILT